MFIYDVFINDVFIYDVFIYDVFICMRRGKGQNGSKVGRLKSVSVGDVNMIESAVVTQNWAEVMIVILVHHLVDI